jgi:hypothetical protein
MSTYAAKRAAEHAMESVRLATARRNSDVADVRDDERREKEAIDEYDDDAAYDDMARALYSDTSDGVASKSQTDKASHSEESGEIMSHGITRRREDRTQSGVTIAAAGGEAGQNRHEPAPRARARKKTGLVEMCG